MGIKPESRRGSCGGGDVLILTAVGGPSCAMLIVFVNEVSFFNTIEMYAFPNRGTIEYECVPVRKKFDSVVDRGENSSQKIDTDQNT